MAKNIFKFTLFVALAVVVLLISAQNASAAVNAPTTPTSTSNITASSIRYNWTWGGGEEDRWVLERSTNGSDWTFVATTTATTTANYTYTGLATNTLYYFRVGAATSTSVTSTYATSSAVYTAVEQVSAPTIGTANTSSLPITINIGGNPAATTYALYNTTTANYLNSAGAVTTTPVWQTTSTWGASFAATGLSLNTLYQFAVISRNGDNTEAATSTVSTAKYTLASQASTPTIGTPTVSTLPVTININSNPAATTYALYNFTSGNYLASNGSSTTTPVWQTTSTWGAAFAATGLSVNSAYQFNVIARNGDSVEAATSTTSTAKYTLANAASAPTIGTAATSSLPITININSNPAATTYALYNTTTANYLNSAGAATTTPVWQTTSTWGASFAATGLSLNTLYQFAVISRNGDNTEAATSTVSTAKYTLATAPTMGETTNVGSSNATMNWTGNGTQYYAENTNNGANSGWISGVSSAFTGLSCNVSYIFRVKSRNGDSTETDWSASTTVSLTNCGGSSPGGGSPSPTVTTPVTTVVTSTIVAPITTPAPVSAPVTATTPVSSVITPVATVSETAVQNPDSLVVIENIAKVSFQPGEPLKFTYNFTNDNDASLKIKIVRQLLSSKGKVLKSASAFRVLKSGQTAVVKVNETIAKKQSPGNYTVKVAVYNSQTSKLIDSNSFGITVEKLKKKFLVLGENISSEYAAIKFDLSGVKISAGLPAMIKGKYNYTNQSADSQAIRMVRELQGPDGKVIAKKIGKWTMTAGESYWQGFTQAVGGNLAAGPYLISVKAYDYATGDLLEQNSFGFNVVLK